MTNDAMNEVVDASGDAAELARPLQVLIPLIQDDLNHGREAAERAGMPYYRAAGEKLLEAKWQMEHGTFLSWVARNFRIGKSQTAVYMALATAATKEKSGAPDFSSLREFERQTGRRSAGGPEPVRKIVGRVDTAALNLAREEAKRAEERDGQRKLGLRLIDSGYKLLARKLHPDHGGCRDAMARLNAVRERLKVLA